MDTNDAVVVQLQINNSGAWKTIARFDADDEAAWHYARTGVSRIALTDASATNWRIATVAPLPKVLEVFSMSRGWRAKEARQ